MKEAPDRNTLYLFVYGTLKRGERNHERFCQGAREIEEATARGALYDPCLGFPVLVVREEDVYAVGTGDYPGDAGLSGRFSVSPPEDLEGWDVVTGELLRFDDPERRLPGIDGLEGFRPGEDCFYTRVLIRVSPVNGGAAVLAWAYSVAEGSGTRLRNGIWPDRD